MGKFGPELNCWGCYRKDWVLLPLALFLSEALCHSSKEIFNQHFNAFRKIWLIVSFLRDPHDLVQPCILAEVTGATSFFPCTASFSVPSKVGRNWCEWLCLGFSKLIMESLFFCDNNYDLVFCVPGLVRVCSSCSLIPRADGLCHLFIHLRSIYWAYAVCQLLLYALPTF